MPDSRPTRRAWLVGSALPLATALAGCTDALPSMGEPTPPTYERLRRTAVHVARAVDLDLPEEVQTVGSPDNADLIVLPATTDVAAGTAVDWLADGKILALLGGDAEATWHRWQDTDVYGDTFGGGRSDASPDPELLAAYAVGVEYVSTYRTTWGHTDDPSDAEVLDALETALREAAAETPRD